jgi:hypothetical protein
MNVLYFAFVIFIAIAAYTFFSRRKTQGAAPSNLPPKFRIPVEYAVPDTPVSFGYKCNWLAVYTQDTQKLADLIHLREVHSCNWKNGVEYAYEDRVFVSPPVDGWSFVVSKHQLPFAENAESVNLLKMMLIELSKEFSQACYFGTYRVVGYDCWMKAVDGNIERAYSLVDGSNIIVEGDPTPVEMKYNLINTLSEEAENDPNYFDRKDIRYPDEDLTMEVAGGWAIDPQTLEDRKDVLPALGLVGTLK